MALPIIAAKIIQRLDWVLIDFFWFLCWCWWRVVNWVNLRIINVKILQLDWYLHIWFLDWYVIIGCIDWNNWFLDWYVIIGWCIDHLSSRYRVKRWKLDLRQIHLSKPICKLILSTISHNKVTCYLATKTLIFIR
jgi:hypothetical protein